ncbi:MAG: hypothetical protein KatS3mg050_4084 [Litorilinea sp.]|nr:MAG: hypothetical protein KatS3mg050_4084 [Litorilinea sp.]
MKCPHCHTDNPAGSRFCNHCGEPLPASPTPPAAAPESGLSAPAAGPPPEPAGSRGSLPVRLLALVAVALVLVVIGWLLFSRQQRQRELAFQATATHVAAQATSQAAAEQEAAALATRSAQGTATQAAAAATAAFAPTATQAALAVRYARGVEAAEAGDWVTALAELRAVFEVDPDYQDVAARLAQVIAWLTATPSPTAGALPTQPSTGGAGPLPPTATFTPTPEPGSAHRHTVAPPRNGRRSGYRKPAPGDHPRADRHPGPPHADLDATPHRYAGPHGDTDPPDGHLHPAARRYADAHRHRDRTGRGHPDGDTGTHPDTNPGGDGHCTPNCDPIPGGIFHRGTRRRGNRRAHGDGHAATVTHRNRHRHAAAHGDGHAATVAHRNRHGHAAAHGDGHAATVTHRNRHATPPPRRRPRRYHRPPQPPRPRRRFPGRPSR